MELAFFAATETSEQWLRRSEAYRRMWQGAKERAQERGYLLNLYPRRAEELSRSRFANILRSRNIHGGIVAPMPTSSITLDIDWTELSVIELGFTLMAPNFHRVVHDYFHAMLMALARARGFGYQRIGLILGTRSDEKVHHLWRAAYMDEQNRHPHKMRVRPLIVSEITANGLSQWLDREKPDAIISIETRPIIDALHVLKLKIPDDIGMVNLGCYDMTGNYAGIYQAYEEMGATAVDQLIAMLQRGERGIPERANSTLVGGVWVDGKSLPARVV